LHEIDPQDWLRLFGERGEISRPLSDDGVVLLVEDHRMPVGEKAHPRGFIVLDTPQLRQLFHVREGDSGFEYYEEGENGRIKAHFIPRGCLMRISDGTKREALSSLSDEAMRRIRSIRAKDSTTYKDGMAHGFWTQQLANAQLSLQS